MKTTFLTTPDYAAFVADLKSRVASAHLGAARSVNRELILLYWDIGQAIVEKQRAAKWGDSVVEQIAADLRRAFPSVGGFSTDYVWRMKQLYTEYSDPEFLVQLVPEIPRLRPFLVQPVPEMKTPKLLPFQGQAVPEINTSQLPAILGQLVPELKNTKLIPFQEQVVPKMNDPESLLILAQVARELTSLLPWGHHLTIMKKIATPAARLYYLLATAQMGWSRAVLLNQIKSSAYERARLEKKTHNFEMALPEHFAEQAAEAMKSRYNLGKTPRGFNIKAQGCANALPWGGVKRKNQPQRGCTLFYRQQTAGLCNPSGVVPFFTRPPRVARIRATLGFDVKPRWGCSRKISSGEFKGKLPPRNNSPTPCAASSPRKKLRPNHEQHRRHPLPDPGRRRGSFALPWRRGDTRRLQHIQR